ncbi:MAG: ribonuclease HII [Elusimicrobiales bacterium]
MLANKNFDLDIIKAYSGRNLIGVDEAGRGPLAGPVVSSACLIKDYLNPLILKIKDSKGLSQSSRERLFREICSCGDIVFSFAYSTNTEIDDINILNASLLSMKRAVERLIKRCGFQYSSVILIVDGNKKIKGLELEQICVVKGDEKSACVGCASIIAKTLRDRWMSYYDRLYPQYGFAKHKGYPTKLHIRNIEKYGLSPLHRTSFAPCKVRV